MDFKQKDPKKGGGGVRWWRDRLQRTRPLLHSKRNSNRDGIQCCKTKRPLKEEVVKSQGCGSEALGEVGRKTKNWPNRKSGERGCSFTISKKKRRPKGKLLLPPVKKD